jgi:hypothetical protein
MNTNENRPFHKNPTLILVTVAMSSLSLFVTWAIEQFARELFRIW